MQIAKHKVVTLEYTLKNDEGNVIDQARDGESFAYIQGTHGIIPGLENALEGKQVGDSLSVSIEPKEGYGERNNDLVQAVPRDRFEEPDKVQVGMQFHTQDAAGNMQIVTVVDVSPEAITVDANHPLAGETLHFDVDVKDIREATQEELDHGHVHGPGGVEH